MACPMDFHFYPADTQFCKTDLKSYAYSNKILTLDWREGKEAAMIRGIQLPSFEVGLGNTVNFSVNTSSAVYSGIRFTIILRRNISFHMLQTYFPSALFVIISFLSFLVAPESIPGRMTLCMTTLLTMVSIFSGVRQSTPTVSYVKGLDIWMVACIICVFLTLVEYTVLLRLRNLKPKHKRKSKKQQKPQQEISCKPTLDNPTLIQQVFGQMAPKTSATEGMGNGNCNNSIGTRVPSAKSKSGSTNVVVTEERKKKSEQLSYKIERYCSKIIPALFVLFNLVYWPWLLSSADYFDYHEIDTTNFSE